MIKVIKEHDGFLFAQSNICIIEIYTSFEAKKNVNFYALYIIQVIEFDYNIDIQLIENSEKKKNSDMAFIALTHFNLNQFNLIQRTSSKSMQLTNCYKLMSMASETSDLSRIIL